MIRDRDVLPDLVYKGITFKVHTERDDDHDAPWEDGDGRGIVTDWLGSYGLREVVANDYDGHTLRLLGREEYGRARYFDMTATRSKALDEGWGLSDEDRAKLPDGYTDEQLLDAIVEKEYEHCEGWACDDWQYIGVIVSLPGTGIEASLWGIESNAGEYLTEVARELADQIIEDRETLRRLDSQIDRWREVEQQILDVREAEDR